MTISTAYRSNVAGNITSYSNKLLDEKLDQAGAILDPIQRSKVMRDIQMIMQDDGPICQPFWQSIFAVMNKRVQNFELHPAGYIFPENWWISE
jgi:peptide/nickel transport system substrate-binding protein